VVSGAVWICAGDFSVSQPGSDTCAVTVQNMVM
jgi:hypothetical protein